jgi:hypothetical protein
MLAKLLVCFGECCAVGEMSLASSSVVCQSRHLGVIDFGLMALWRKQESLQFRALRLYDPVSLVGSVGSVGSVGLVRSDGSLPS